MNEFTKYEKREHEIIGAIKLSIINSIQQFKNLILDDMDDEYFLRLTMVALRECLMNAEFVIDHKDHILSIHNRIGLEVVS